ncbi:hypothetical protein [Rhizobium ruizarguesonis]|uniref:hypothetical protein n=1 Tax=Rhizobium ruizarguesonis TaxID=2081791 RepID=UPI0013D3CB94|nr:hypothetical protein [Rhizobium ruizarguesonis]NEH76849.1 hypothetical protein [Rhizobium ruizarguesonis]
MLELTRDIALYVALFAAIATGIFGLLNNRQKSQLDRKLQLEIAHLGLMKSAFDLRFKDEFETYKALWPSLQTMITTLSLETDHLIEKDGEERAAIIDKDLKPVADKLYTSTIFLPANIRDLAETIMKESYSWRVNIKYPALGNTDIFPPPKKIEELEQDLKRLRDMITTRIDMMPGGFDFGLKNAAKPDVKAAE